LNGIPTFQKEKNGYSRAQVDAYILKISHAYEDLHGEYLNTKERGERLTREKRDLEALLHEAELQNEKLRRSGGNAFPSASAEREADSSWTARREAIADALISAELAARQILANALSNASKIERFAAENITAAPNAAPTPNKNPLAENDRVLAELDRLLAVLPQPDQRSGNSAFPREKPPW